MSHNAKNKIDKIKEIENVLNRKQLMYKTHNCPCSFKIFEKINYFTKGTFNGNSTLDDSHKDQSNWLVNSWILRKEQEEEVQSKKKTKRDTIIAFLHFLW